MAKVVVIDDSKLMRSLLRQFLEAAGHEVEEWIEVTASEVKPRLAAAKPDLLITDYQMPGCNGGTIVKLVRQDQPELPIMVVTADHDPSVARQLNQLNVSRIIHKPIRNEDLLEALKGLLPGT
jgi:DNA-binding NarL/FixJ family response regulator